MNIKLVWILEEMKGEYNQNTLYEILKGRVETNIQRQTYQNHTRIFNKDYESQKRMVRCHSDSKRTQMPV